MTNKIELSDEELEKASGGDITFNTKCQTLVMEDYNICQSGELYTNLPNLSESSKFVLYIAASRFREQKIEYFNDRAMFEDDGWDDIEIYPWSTLKQQYPYHVRIDYK